MISILWAACCLLLAMDEVTVKPLRGESVRGELQQLSEREITVRAPSGTKSFPAAELQSVRPIATPEPPDGLVTPPAILFVDDTTVPFAQFELAEGKGIAQLAAGSEIQFSGTLVRSVKFRKQDEALVRQWDALAAVEAVGDRLIVRKTAGDDPATAAQVVLDQLEGIVHGVAGQKVQFEFDGERIDVPLEKVEGIVFRTKPAGNLPNPACRIRDVRGGEWQVRTLQQKDGKLVFRTVGGLEAGMPFEEVSEIDYSSGNLAYLSDLKPESIDWRPYLVTPATPPTLSKWFGLRRDQASDGSVLTLADRSFEKGLSLHSRTEVSYRLTREYRHFQAVVGIDERFRAPGNVKLVVLGDQRELFSREIRGTDAPVEIDVDMTGVRRLRILVDFGDDRSDAGDHLILGDARLTK